MSTKMPHQTFYSLFYIQGRILKDTCNKIFISCDLGKETCVKPDVPEGYSIPVTPCTFKLPSFSFCAQSLNPSKFPKISDLFHEMHFQHFKNILSWSIRRGFCNSNFKLQRFQLQHVY